MRQVPVGMMAKGFLHGFAALYGIFIVGFLFIFGVSLFMPSGALRNAIMVIGLLGFIVSGIIAIVLRCKKPDIFSVKEEYCYTIRTEGSKTINGEIINEITQLTTPEQIPQIEKGMGESQ